ncbi:hypothetical protein [Marinobacter zhanjiangensis]|uniref:Uncharacterized protein n=1 Tax=Marinobacter zhanjiangensis TaxID=578215 RepID=A0ABQ3AWK0_9GAMM|nr:hypothetical protein [Marinobacter zhanjiangensis]GGY69628.1 hypothetical protein GCM10007071_15660 [Marinobacter zhanjiangensis]
MNCWHYSFAPRRCWRIIGIILLAGLYGPSTRAEPPLLQTLSPEQLPPEFFTFTPEEFWREPEDSYWMAFSNWVIRQEHTQSRRIQALGAWADRTLSGNARSMPDNASYLRLGLAAESRTSDLADFDPEVRFKLDLPTAEEKLRVVVESESEDLIPLEERQRDRQFTDDQRSDTDPTGALSYLTRISDTVNFSNDVGARLRFPPDAFWRTSIRGRWGLSDWRLSARQRVYYFHQDGWGASTRFRLGKDIGKGWSFLASSQAVWKHDDRRFDVAQTFDFHKRLNNRSELNPRIGVVGGSDPDWRHETVFADITWRYRLYQDWLYGEIIPSIEYDRENDFQEETSLLFRIEMFFSGNVIRR